MMTLRWTQHTCPVCIARAIADVHAQSLCRDNLLWGLQARPMRLVKDKGVPMSIVWLIH